jgi:hypothetical protein
MRRVIFQVIYNLKRTFIQIFISKTKFRTHLQYKTLFSILPVPLKQNFFKEQVALLRQNNF